jgi:hypothetical protein
LKIEWWNVGRKINFPLEDDRMNNMFGRWMWQGRAVSSSGNTLTSLAKLSPAGHFGESVRF